MLDKYSIRAQVPANIVAHLEAGRGGRIAETPKTGDVAFARTRTSSSPITPSPPRPRWRPPKGSGFHTLLLSTYVEGEAREVAKVVAAIAREIAHSGRPLPRPACVVAGGETTVTLRGEGRGGRNQELALAAAIQIGGLPDTLIAALATDGSDGPTDAAGALAEGETLAWAAQQGLKAQDYLSNNDSYRFFQALGDLLLTGPTNTNVNDLTFVFVF